MSSVSSYVSCLVIGAPAVIRSHGQNHSRFRAHKTIKPERARPQWVTPKLWVIERSSGRVRLRAASSVRKWPLARTALRSFEFSASMALVV